MLARVYNTILGNNPVQPENLPDLPTLVNEESTHARVINRMSPRSTQTVLLTWSFILCVFKIAQTADAARIFFFDSTKTTDYKYETYNWQFDQFIANFSNGVCGADPSISLSEVAANYAQALTWTGRYEPTLRATLFRGTGTPINTTFEECIDGLVSPFNQGFEAWRVAKAAAEAAARAEAEAALINATAAAAAEARAKAAREAELTLVLGLSLGLGIPGAAAIGVSIFLFFYCGCHKKIQRSCDKAKQERANARAQKLREREEEADVEEVNIPMPVIEESSSSSSSSGSSSQIVIESSDSSSSSSAIKVIEHREISSEKSSSESSTSSSSSSPEEVILSNSKMLESYNYEGEIPERFLCHFSHDIMTIPQLLDDGRNYDSTSIDIMLQKPDTTCPFDPNKKITSRPTNFDLLSEIDTFMKEIKDMYEIKEEKGVSSSPRLGQ